MRYFCAISRKLALASCSAAAFGVLAHGAMAQEAKGALKGPELASHRAIYVLTLGKSRDGRGPNSAKGKIQFDFSGNRCEGYAQNLKQSTELQLPDGPARLSDLSISTFEDGTGGAYRYHIESKENIGSNTNIDGRAAMDGKGAIDVTLTRPKAANMLLTSDALFPTDHLEHILATARAGDHLFARKLFDGSDTGTRIFDTLAVIGAPNSTEAAEAAAHLPALQNMRRWPVTISYFDEGKKDSEPLYTLSFDLYENGVSRALVVDYGDFSLKGELTELEFLPSKPCDK